RHRFPPSGFTELEIEFRAQLNHTRRHAAHAAANAAEGLIVQSKVNGLRVGVEVVKQVENLRAEFKRARLADLEPLVDRKVGVDDARQPNRARARRCAEAPERRSREGSRVEPSLPGALVSRQVSVLPG